MKPVLIALVLAPALAHAPLALARDADARFAATTLDISAHGEVKAPPDMATITLGVDTTAPTASQAMAANAERMNRVIAALRTAGLADRDVQTTEISLSPQYAYDQGQPPRLTGYQASNKVSVAEHDLSRLGKLADAVVAAGATDINQISFGLSNPVAAENLARVDAVKALEDKARLYANAAGYRIGRLISLSEGGGYQPSPPRPMMALAARNVAAPPPPVAAGELEVRVDVRGVFELTK
ncbi:MAG: SIMPL domain-containing protein [Caulobacteraceae bacterium]